MKQKSKQRKLQKGQSELKASTQTVGPESQPVAAAEPGHVSTERLDYPPPEYVAEMARGEPNVRLVEDYTEAIEILRDEKRLTFREIAEWLQQKFGIEADHNAVWRAYTKGLPENEAVAAAHEDEEDERDLIQG
jgi:hypothetical protein